MRLQRVLWVMVRDWRLILGGRGWFRLPLIAAMLLLPVALTPAPERDSAPPPPAVPSVSGEVPQAVMPHIEVKEQGGPRFTDDDPPRIAGEVMPPLRAILDEHLPGPTVQLDVKLPAFPVSWRPMLVLLLAISLLTGPMSESLPGERSEHTLEVMLAAAITPLELVTGKWLAWTLAAGLSGAGAIAGGIATGATSPGAWVVGIPLGVGIVVAVAMYLVRHAADVVGGATVPMRVLPLAAAGALGLAWWATTIHPLLGAATPLGGSMLLAGGAIHGLAAFATVVLSHLAMIGALLVRASKGLTELDVAPEQSRARPWGIVVPALFWWLAVGGGGVWLMAGVDLKAASPASAAAAGGALLLATALVTAARRGAFVEMERPTLRQGVVAVVAGLLLAGATPVIIWEPSGLMAPVAARLQGAAVAIGPAGLVALVGQELVFRWLIAERYGWKAGVVAWTAIVFPFDPLGGIVSGVVLVAMAAGGGMGSAFIARLAWWLAASVLAGA